MRLCADGLTGFLDMFGMAMPFPKRFDVQAVGRLTARQHAALQFFDVAKYLVISDDESPVCS